VVSLETHRVKRNLQARVEDVRGLLARHTPQARQMLRKLFPGRLEFEAVEESGRRGYRFTGKGSYLPVLVGEALPPTVVAPYLKALRCQALCCSAFPLALFPGAWPVGAHTSCRDTLRLKAPPIRPPPCLGTLPALADPRIAPFRRSHIFAV